MCAYDSEVVELPVDEILAETPKACLYRFGNRTVWLPKILLTSASNNLIIEIPLWLAVDKDLESYII